MFWYLPRLREGDSLPRRTTEEQAAWRIGDWKVAGIAAGVCVAVLPMAAMVQTESKTSSDLQAKTIKNDSIRAVDLTNGHPDAVLLRGQVSMLRKRRLLLELLLA